MVEEKNHSSAGYASFTLQQRLTNLKVAHLMEPNSLIRNIRKLNLYVVFKQPRNISAAYFTAFYKAFSSITARPSYGQTCILSWLRIIQRNGSDLCEIFDWLHTKQTLICHSSSGAEIFACPEGDDRGLYSRSALRSIFPALQTPK